jgi:hypothetical protein
VIDEVRSVPISSDYIEYLRGKLAAFEEGSRSLYKARRGKMTNYNKSSMLELIRANIAKYGHHVTLVIGGKIPRFAYTWNPWE